jgi:hypothetical protein
VSTRDDVVVEFGDQINAVDERVEEAAFVMNISAFETYDDDPANAGYDELPRSLVVTEAPVVEPETEARTSKYRVEPAGTWIAVAVPPEVVTPTVTFGLATPPARVSSVA